MAINEKCTCPKVNCKLHGNCKECMEKHKDNLPACKSGKLMFIK